MSAQNFAQFSSPQEARQAYQGDGNGNDGGGDGENGGEDGEWTDWQRIQQAGDWWVYGREKVPRTNVQFHITGQLEDGSQVYLNRSGEVVDEMAILENMDEVNAALQNYAQRREDGDVPGGRQPTGSDPGPGRGGGGGGSTKRKLAIVAIVLIVAIYYYRYHYDGDLELPIVGDVLDDGGDTNT